MEDEYLEEAGEPFTVSNEFATVRITKVHTRNGERLMIEAPRLGHMILLDSLELESISWQPPETFSKFLETPFGPL
ncbi:MAG: dihydrodiol dehydrogenase [Actinobacteria bacterium]|nr:dihydrodiol dehydrogenase [Actinomycetota bacterium]